MITKQLFVVYGEYYEEDNEVYVGVYSLIKISEKYYWVEIKRSSGLGFGLKKFEDIGYCDPIEAVVKIDGFTSNSDTSVQKKLYDVDFDRVIYEYQKLTEDMKTYLK